MESEAFIVVVLPRRGGPSEVLGVDANEQLSKLGGATGPHLSLIRGVPHA